MDGSVDGGQKGEGPKHKRRSRLVLTEGTKIVYQSPSSLYDYMTDGQDAPPPPLPSS